MYKRRKHIGWRHQDTLLHSQILGVPLAQLLLFALSLLNDMRAAFVMDHDQATQSPFPALLCACTQSSSLPVVLTQVVTNPGIWLLALTYFCVYIVRQVRLKLCQSYAFLSPRLLSQIKITYQTAMDVTLCRVHQARPSSQWHMLLRPRSHKANLERRKTLMLNLNSALCDQDPREVYFGIFCVSSALMEHKGICLKL